MDSIDIQRRFQVHPMVYQYARNDRLLVLLTVEHILKPVWHHQRQKMEADHPQWYRRPMYHMELKVK